MERRYLIVPGIDSSRIHILDTKPDPRQPKIVRVIEPEEFTARTGYTGPHTIHCGPEGIYGSALGSASGDGPGGIFTMDPDSFDVLGKWEMDRGPQPFAGLGNDALLALLMLGAYHGINPGMGWLFAVALGMQEKSGRAVARSLIPIALGHAMAIGIVVLAAGLLQKIVPLGKVKIAAALILFGFGGYRL